MQLLHGFYQQKLVETRESIERMKTLEKELESSLQYLEVCQGCTTQSGIDSCADCDNVEHSDSETPCMVAAIATPA